MVFVIIQSEVWLVGAIAQFFFCNILLGAYSRGNEQRICDPACRRDKFIQISNAIHVARQYQDYRVYHGNHFVLKANRLLHDKSFR